MSKNRAFVRYNKKGILAPGSLVVTKNYPSASGNLWYEVPTHLLGGVVLTTSFNVTTLPWNYAPGNAIELSMGCMSNTSDYLDLYAPTKKDLISPADIISHLNNKVSFLGTFELGKIDGDNQEIIFNLSPQLAEDLNKPNATDGGPCGFSISFYID
jgi:hypothetical protein